jgi:hypothetical protein
MRLERVRNRPRPIVLPVLSSAFSAREVRTAPDTGALDPALGFDALRTLLLRSLRALLLFVVLVRGRRLARYGASVGRGDPSCGVDHPFRGRTGRAQSPDRGKRGKERDRQSTGESHSQPRACPAPLCANALGEGDNKFGTRLRSRPPQLILDVGRLVPTPEPFHWYSPRGCSPSPYTGGEGSILTPSGDGAACELDCSRASRRRSRSSTLCKATSIVFVRAPRSSAI